MWAKVSFYTLLFFLILILSIQTSPQNNIQALTKDLNFEQYTTDQGLSAPIVRNIIQDSKGYLWFATYSGLDRYDGVEFKSYKHIPDDTLSITNGFVQTLLEDKACNLWLGTTQGLDKFNTYTETFEHYKPYNHVQAFDWKKNNIFSIQEDQDGSLWIGTGDGLNKFDPVTKKFIHYRNDPFNQSSLRHNSVYALLIDKAGVLWVGTGNGLENLTEKLNHLFIFRMIRFTEKVITKIGLEIKTG